MAVKLARRSAIRATGPLDSPPGGPISARYGPAETFGKAMFLYEVAAATLVDDEAFAFPLNKYVPAANASVATDSGIGRLSASKNIESGFVKLSAWFVQF